MEKGLAGGRPWRHILAVALWLCLAPPVGLWKLWQDKILSRSDKWRVLIYLCVIPFLVYWTLSLLYTSQKMQSLLP